MTVLLDRAGPSAGTTRPAPSAGAVASAARPHLAVDRLGKDGRHAVRALRGRRLAGLPVLGPAFVAAVAYVDPGNFATNFSAGASHGYLLLWVVVAANVVAMLLQVLSAKLGLATGHNLPQLCRRHFPRPVVLGLWGAAELVALATELAEVIGGAVALQLLFGLPLLAGGAITGGVALGLLSLQSRGCRPFERAIVGLLAVVLLGFLATMLRIDIDQGAATAALVPHLDGSDSLMLATGILGATVMPHVIYLHSELTARRTDRQAGAGLRRRMLRHTRADVVIAMTLAGAVNAMMLLIAAALFSGGALPGASDIPGVHAGLARVVDQPAALAFALALLASGFASASVGTYAGQVVMGGFLRRAVPLHLRRGLTIAPALAVLAAGVDPTRALVLSQVVLSFGIPFALVPLVLLTRRRDVMGALVNRRLTTAAAALAAAAIITLNAVLLLGTLS